MTKEKLEKEAGNYADEHAFRVPYDGSNKFYDDVDFKASKEGYLAGAEPREKRIAELEAQIEKMKKYGKLLQDICDVMGNDPYMVWRGLEQRVLILWDKSEEEKGYEEKCATCCWFYDSKFEVK